MPLIMVIRILGRPSKEKERIIFKNLQSFPLLNAHDIDTT